MPRPEGTLRVAAPLTAGAGLLAGVADAARQAEDAGLDVLSCSEVKCDPMLQLTLAAGSTERLGLMTNIAVAFARTPMVMAQQGWALNEYSGGRLTMGLGSQIKPHIERRFSMPWSRPAARMAEYVAAMRAIWSCWRTGEKLDFRGDFYQHTLMTPMFVPEGSPPDPKVYLAAVGERMTETAGQVADGLLLHAFTTPTYVREVTLPAVEKGRARSDMADRSFDVACSGFVVTGRTEEEMAASRRAVAEQIAFYGSTPAYRPVFEVHGWSDLGTELHRLSVSGDEDRWTRMGELITDDVLAEFAVLGAPDEIGPAMRARWGGLCSLYQVNGVGIADSELVMRIAAGVREAGN